MAQVNSQDTAGFADRQLLRDLAKQVADIASLPIQAERARLWQDLNSLRPRRPMVSANPQNGWAELLPESAMRCDNLRWLERELRTKIFRHEHIPDDHPITDTIFVGAAVCRTDFGIDSDLVRTEERGAYRIDAVIKTPADFARMRHRNIRVDREQTARNVGVVQDVIGDILQVKPRAWDCRFGLTRVLVHLRGLEQLLMDMYDNPGFLHEMMAFLRDDMASEWDALEREGALYPNSGPEDVLGTGGHAPVDDLPADDHSGRLRLKDLWAWGESQETVGVGPAQFEEFVLQYQLPLMNRFGLVNYGCCEPLDSRIDLLIGHIPRLRVVAVPTWSDRELMARKLQNNYVYAYKPNPSYISAPRPDYDAAEREIRDTLEQTRGCCLSITMKDTHTFHNEPDRITRWAEMACRLAQEAV